MALAFGSATVTAMPGLPPTEDTIGYECRSSADLRLSLNVLNHRSGTGALNYTLTVMSDGQQIASDSRLSHIFDGAGELFVGVQLTLRVKKDKSGTLKNSGGKQDALVEGLHCKEIVVRR